MNQDDLVWGLDVLTGRIIDSSLTGIKLPESIRDEGNAVQTHITNVYEGSRRWTHSRGTQGLGIADKITEGKSTGELSLKIYVEKKCPLSKLKEPVPKQVEIPGLGRIETDVEEIGKVTPEVYTGKARPAMPGCGLGHTKVNAGTYGCLVRKKGNPSSLYILSNSHILAASGEAALGDRIIQPAKYDNGRVSQDTLATLSEFIPFKFGKENYENTVDAAIALVKDNHSVTDSIRQLAYVPKGIGRSIKREMKVQKVGRTTDHTLGFVRDVHYRLHMPYILPSGKRKYVGFRDVIMCSRFTAPGDSGSAVLNDRGYLIGLHFGGSPSTSIFCKITNVFKLLDLELPK